MTAPRTAAENRSIGPSAASDDSDHVSTEEPVRSDAEARLRALMAEHGGPIHSYCVRVLGDPTLASDVHQQVFVQAWRDLPTLRQQQGARAWLFGIASHRCLDAIKARRRWFSRFVSADDEALAVPAPAAEAVEHADATKRARALEECVGALAAESRMAVLLRFQQEMTYEQMAHACREKAGTLQARVARAMPALRRCLEGKGFEP